MIELKEFTDTTTYWQEIINDLKNSGLSARQYASKHNIVEHKLGYWKRKLESNNTIDIIKVTTDLPIIDNVLTNTISKDTTPIVDNQCEVEIKIKELIITIKGNNSLSDIFKNIIKG